MFQLPQEVQQVIHTIEQAGFEAVIVGGPVRDLLRVQTPHDWDIATSARPEQVMEWFSKTIPTGLRHGTVTVLMGNMPLEVTTYRQEAAYQNHRKPTSVAFVSNLEEDLKRRDFTINAMAYRMSGEVVDLIWRASRFKTWHYPALSEMRVSGLKKMRLECCVQCGLLVNWILK